MNIANKLTVARIILIPFFIAALICDFIPYNTFAAVVIFVVASLTDFLDGYYARSRNMITDFGRFLDPLADKILTISALVCFIQLDLISSIPVIIIITREFLVTSVRLAANSSDGTVISANKFGKIKTTLQMITIISVLILSIVGGSFPESYTKIISEILIWITTIVTVASGIEIVWSYRSYIDPDK